MHAMMGVLDVEREKRAIKTAKQRVAQALPTPEHLSRLDAYRDSTLNKRQSLESQINSLVKTHLDQVMQGLSALQISKEQTLDLKNSFTNVDEAIMECSNLIPDFELIRDFNTIRNNVKNTFQEALRLQEVPHNIRLVRKYIDDPKRHYQVLKLLRSLQKRRLNELESAERNSLSVPAKMQEHFRSIDVLTSQFKDQICETIGNFLFVAQKNPRSLEFAIVSNEICFAAPTFSAAHPSSRLQSVLEKPSANAEDPSLNIISQAVAQRFHSLSDMENADSTEEMSELLGKILDDLSFVCNEVPEFFPPRFNFKSFIVDAYNMQFHHFFANMAGKAKGDRQALFYVGWVAKDYAKALAAVGVNMSDLRPSLIDTLFPVIRTFKEETKKQMYKWCDNIIEQDLTEKDYTVVDDQLSTYAPFDLFQFVTEYMEMVLKTECSTVVIEIAHSIASALLYYEEKEKSLLVDGNWKNLDFTYLIVLLNNNNKCCFLTEELESKIEDSIDPEQREFLDLDPAINGFLSVIDTIISCIVLSIFGDLDVALVQLFNKEWYDERNVMESVTDCIDKYFEDDFVPNMLEIFVTKLAKQCLDTLVQRYVEELLATKHSPKFDSKTAEIMRIDIVFMRKLFDKYLRIKDTETSLQVVEDFQELLEAEPDMICLYFMSLLRHHPDVTPNVVEYFLSQRVDLDKDKSQIKLAMEGCQKVWDESKIQNPPAGIFTKLSLPYRLPSIF